MCKFWVNFEVMWVWNIVRRCWNWKFYWFNFMHMHAWCRNTARIAVAASVVRVRNTRRVYHPATPPRHLRTRRATKTTTTTIRGRTLLLPRPLDPWAAESCPTVPPTTNSSLLLLGTQTLWTVTNRLNAPPSLKRRLHCSVLWSYWCCCCSLSRSFCTTV